MIQFSHIHKDLNGIREAHNQNCITHLNLQIKKLLASSLEYKNSIIFNTTIDHEHTNDKEISSEAIYGYS